MVEFLLTAQIISSRPPLTPEEAVNVLRASRSAADHTVALTAPVQPTREYHWGLNDSGVYVLNSRTGDGPYGPFPAYPEPINTSGWLFTAYTGPRYRRHDNYHRYDGYRGERTFLPRPTTPPHTVAPPIPPRHVVIPPARSGSVRR